MESIYVPLEARGCFIALRFGTARVHPVRDHGSPGSSFQFVRVSAFHRASREQSLDYLPINIGQTEFPSLIFERQLFVVDSQKMQHRGVQVVDVNGIF